MNDAQRLAPLRVGLVLYQDSFVFGGGLRVGLNLAGALDRSRADPCLLFAYGAAGASQVTLRAQTACHFLGASGHRDPRAWLRLRRLVTGLRLDVLHFVDPVLWAQAATLGLRPRRLVHYHGRFLPGYVKPRDRVAKTLSEVAAHARVSISFAARESHGSAHSWGKGPTFVVYNSVDTDWLTTLPDKQAARAALRLPPECLVLGLVARLVEHKGWRDLLQLLRRLDGRWHVALAGSGPDAARIQEEARRLGLSQRTHLVGVCEDVSLVYAALDALAFLSRYDSFGLVIAEAMAAGIPVFGLRGDGEYAEPEYPLITPDNAVFVERAHPLDYDTPEEPVVLDALAARLTEFADHAARFAPMRADATKWVRRRFDAHIQAEAMTRVYEIVTGRRDPATAWDRTLGRCET